MFLELNQLFFLNLQKMCWSIFLVIIIFETMILELKTALVAAAAFIERFQSSAQLTFDCCFYFQKFQLYLSFALCTKPSTASMNDSTKLRGWELQRNIGMVIRFEDIETDMGTCLPIQVVVSLFLNFPSGIQIDSKSKTARLVKSLWSSVYWISNESSLSNSVSRIWYTFFGYICFTRSLHLTKCRSKFPVFWKYVSQVGQRKALKSAWMLST